MSELILTWRAKIDSVREAFLRLTSREQLMVLATGGVVLLLLLFLVGSMVSGAIDRAESRVHDKTNKLAQVLALQDEYKAREKARQDQLVELGRTQTRLVSIVEETARQSGVEIGQLRPEDGTPGAGGIYESRVELKASNLSADKLQDFLSRLETSPGLVIIRRVRVVRPYRKDTVELELTVTTYRMKSTG